MGNVNAREMERTETTQVHLDGIEAQVVKVHIDGLVRTKEDLVLVSI